jgi:hypothetical protein
MGAKFDNSMQGVLFPNTKEGNEKRPDYSGQCEISCTKCNHPNSFWMSGWKNFSRTRLPFLKIYFREKLPKPEGQAVQDDFNDKIPF